MAFHRAAALAAAAALILAVGGVAFGQDSAKTSPIEAGLLSRLANPKEADDAKLTDVQRIKISTLIQERAQALAKAGSDKPRVTADFDVKASRVLTREQRSALASPPKKIEPRLVFNFRFQKWVDVLEWFAQQCDLSLVLDAPPPGTFNYSDTREYSPSEAIDLLNGVLQTKDFTLVRRGRMLIVLDLKNGVPDEQIPQIELKELDERGKFELVRVMFPLASRSASDVDAEIKPLLSRHGKSVPLSKTKQILVTDHAGIMRAVAAVINSMPDVPTAGAKAGETAIIAVYPLKGVDGEAAVATLKALAPTATFVYDPKSQQINAFATPSQQAAVKVVVGQLQAETPAANRPRLELYPLEPAVSDTTVQSLSAAFPKVQIRYDSPNARLVVWGTPDEQRQVKAVLAKLDESAPSAAKRVLRVYPVTADPQVAHSMLQQLFPHTRILLEPKNRRLLVWAPPDEQVTVAEALEKIDGGANGSTKERLMLFPFSDADPQVAIAMIQQQHPDVRLTSDTVSKSIIAWGNPAELDSVGRIVKQLQAKKPVSQVYRLQNADPSAAVAVLQSVVPLARMSADVRNRSLVVSAFPEDHLRIQSAVEQMDQAGAGEHALVLKSYPLASAEASNVVSMLQTLYATSPEVRISTDPKTQSVVALATPAQQQAIKKSIEDLDKQSAARLLRVYRFKSADPNAAAVVLGTLAPKAQVAVDNYNRSLVVSALESEHEKIKRMVDEIDGTGAAGGLRELRSYPLAAADPQTVLSVLQTLFAQNPEVRLSVDMRTDTIIALATSEQQATIHKSVDEMEKKGSGRTTETYALQHAQADSAVSIVSALAPRAQVAVDRRTNSLVVSASKGDHARIRAAVSQLDIPSKAGTNATVRAYRLQSVDPSSILGTVQGLFAADPEVRVSVDTASNALVVLANKDQHAKVEQLIAQIDGESRGRRFELEVFSLEAVDPFTAEMAIGKLFANATPNVPSPSVESDQESQQLFVRGTKEQLSEIRRLLTKMGEPALAGSVPQTGDKRRLRVIHFNGDAESAIREIERVWPRIRGNEIRVVVPSAVAPNLRQSRTPAETPGDTHPSAVPKSESSPAAPAPAEKKPNGQGQFSVSDEPPPNKPATGQKSLPPVKSSSNPTVIKAPSPAPAPDQTQPPQGLLPRTGAGPQPGSAAKPPVVPPVAGRPPIIISPGDGTITIASDDPEALDQLETLLRTMSRRGEGRGSDFIVFSLRHAAADSVAGLLQQLFRSGAFGGFVPSRVQAVADDRLNAVVVRASRSERRQIEELLRVLDAPEVPEVLARDKPRIIPIKNTRAERIVDVMRGVYRKQLTATGSRRGIPVPTGVSAEVAAAIQQVNASSAGPLLTLEADEDSNSIVVIGPGSLVAEIERLVAELDTASVRDVSHTLKLLPLESTNSRKLRDVLDRMLERQRQNRPGRRSGG